ncbi:MAG: hypothetical protein ABSB12_03470 [Candidatus Saccharimonadales bacterium]|jgi:hypothetical protein
MESHPHVSEPKSLDNKLLNARERIANANSHEEVTIAVKGLRGARRYKSLGLKSFLPFTPERKISRGVGEIGVLRHVPFTQARSVSRGIIKTGSSKHADLFHKQVAESAPKPPEIPKLSGSTTMAEELTPKPSIVISRDPDKAKEVEIRQTNQAALLASARSAQWEHLKTAGVAPTVASRLLAYPGLNGRASRRDRILGRTIKALDIADKTLREKQASEAEGIRLLSNEQRDANEQRYAELIGRPLSPPTAESTAPTKNDSEPENPTEE